MPGIFLPSYDKESDDTNEQLSKRDRHRFNAVRGKRTKVPEYKYELLPMLESFKEAPLYAPINSNDLGFTRTTRQQRFSHFRGRRGRPEASHGNDVSLEYLPQGDDVRFDVDGPEYTFDSQDSSTDDSGSRINEDNRYGWEEISPKAWSKNLISK